MLQGARLGLGLAVVAALLAPVVAQVGRADATQTRTNITGTYESNWDAVSLVQNGDRVAGTYVCCGGGTIEGRIVEGRIVRYRWKQPGGEGAGVWTIDGSHLAGTWGVGQSTSDGGRWDLVRGNSQIAN